MGKTRRSRKSRNINKSRRTRKSKTINKSRKRVNNRKHLRISKNKTFKKIHKGGADTNFPDNQMKTLYEHFLDDEGDMGEDEFLNMFYPDCNLNIEESYLKEIYNESSWRGNLKLKKFSVPLSKISNYLNISSDQLVETLIKCHSSLDQMKTLYEHFLDDEGDMGEDEFLNMFYPDCNLNIEESYLKEIYNESSWRGNLKLKKFSVPLSKISNYLNISSDQLVETLIKCHSSLDGDKWKKNTLSEFRKRHDDLKRGALDFPSVYKPSVYKASTASHLRLQHISEDQPAT